MNKDLLTKINVLKEDIKDIEKRTNENLANIKKDKFDLLRQSVDKIHNKYNDLINSISGSIVIRFDYEDKLYELAIVNQPTTSGIHKFKKYAYVSGTGYSPDEIIIATELAGMYPKYGSKYDCQEYAKMYGLTDARGSGVSYRAFYIKMLIDSESVINEAIEKAVEEKYQKQALEQKDRLAKEMSLLESLAGYVN